MMNHIPSSSDKASVKDWLGLSVLALACVLYVMDLTVLHLAVPQISAKLKPSSAQLLWIIDIYGFMVAGFLVTMGTLGDRIGRRKLLLFGSAAFGLVSVLAAYSSSAEMLVLNRAILGIAGATIAPSTLSLIFSMFRNPKERSFAIAIWISAFSAGSGLGPVLGGLVLERYSWGPVFLLALPVMVLLLLLGPFILPEYKNEKAGSIDLLSVLLSLLGILPFIYSFKKVAQGGLTWDAVFSFFTGILFIYLFLKRQSRLEDPLIDLSLFKVKSFNAALMVNVMVVFIAFGYFLFVAQFLQLILGLSPFVAGLWSLPSALAFIAGSNLVPRLTVKVKPAYVIAGCIGLAGTGLIILSGVSIKNGLVVVITASVIISLGLAPVFGLTTELIVGSAPEEQSGSASGIAETASELGGAIGISILGSIGTYFFRERFSGDSLKAIDPEKVEAARDTLGAALEVANTLESIYKEKLIAAAQQGFISGMKTASVMCAALAVVAIMVTLSLLKNVGGAKNEL